LREDAENPKQEIIMDWGLLSAEQAGKTNKIGEILTS
jgi:hypothetical protein